MKTILITGAEGFIGKNLRAHLGQRKDLSVIGYDVGNTLSDLEAGLAQAEFVFHLAGVNRPKDPAEFDSGNRGLTEDIVSILKKNGKAVPLLVSSSIQAALDNPYGKSKHGAENSAFEYGARTGAPVYVFRLPNVFGKWCRPNYNSVVATWCHNTANGLPIQMNDPRTELSLVYVDDVASSFVRALDGGMQADSDGFCRVPVTYKRTLAQLASSLDSFAQSRKTLVMPALSDAFERRLYCTWLSYLPTDGFAYPLELKRDDRGSLAEFIKSQAFGQVFVSKTKPGITRGNHWHHTKVEKFLVLSGKAIIRFRKIDSQETLEYPVDGDAPRVVDIPVGYTHSITNVGETELITIFWADEIFDPQSPDTYFLEV
jgi:UDP-2-acetamido-2,6-beta-L-arabino-hexul-4-ose reductase